MAQTKIGVDRLKLIQAIRDAKAAEEQRFAPLLAEFEDEQGRIREIYLSRLKSAIVRIEGGVPYETRVDQPSGDKFYGRKPECKTFGMDRHIAMLEMCSAETVAVNSEDFGVYFR